MSNTDSKKKVPLIRISKRDVISKKKCWGIRIIAAIVAMIAVGIFVGVVTGAGPGETFNLLFTGAFGNQMYIKGTLFFIAKLLCIAVALAPAFKMRFWNIGAEGQVLIGALISSILMVKFSTMPNGILIPLMLVSSIVLGAIWGLIPAIFKAHWNVNETLFTLMMNYVAIQTVDYFYNSWKGSKASLGIINPGTEAGWLPEVITEFNLIVVVSVLAITILMFVYLKYTKQGYEIAVVGESQNTAKYAGISVKKTIIRIMIISGAVCGICGFLTVSGQNHTISSSDTGGGYGFTAIIVAWLAKFNTLVMILIATLVVFLERGTQQISNQYQQQGFDSSASKIVIGLVLFIIIGSEFFINYKLHFRGNTGKED